MSFLIQHSEQQIIRPEPSQKEVMMNLRGKKVRIRIALALLSGM